MRGHTRVRPASRGRLQTFVRRQSTGHRGTFSHTSHRGRSRSASRAYSMVRFATRVIQSRSLTGDGERLARCSSGQKVDCSHIRGSNLREISEVRNSAIGGQSNYVANGCRALFSFLARRRVVRAGHVLRTRCAMARAQQPAAEGINFGEGRGLPAERLPRNRDGFDSRAHGEVSHSHSPYLDSQAGGGRIRNRLFCLPPRSVFAHATMSSTQLMAMPGDAGHKEGAPDLRLPCADLVDHFGKARSPIQDVVFVRVHAGGAAHAREAERVERIDLLR